MNPNFSIIWGTRQIRNSQILLYVACAVKQLKGMGLKPGERVAICDANTVEYVILLLALWQIKVVAVPISPRWPDKTISAYAAKINARHILRGSEIQHIVCFDARHQVEAGGYKELDLSQEATIIATSGSSGEAKAVLHTWGNHFFSAQGSQELIALTGSGRWLLSLPLYHISGMAILARCLIAGAGLVIASHDDVMPAIERGKVTHVSLVSTQLQRFLNDPKNLQTLRTLKYVLLGGSAIPKALLEQAIQAGLNVYLSYGLTEMSSQVATGKVQAGGQACVKVLPYRELKISSEGEILVKGEVLLKGYISGNKVVSSVIARSEATKQSFGDDQWFATGDMGSLSSEGCLTVTGRCDSMFICGGENIHPEEIEKALLNIKGVVQAMVVPKDDEEFGKRPMAFVQFDGKPLSSEALIKALEMDLPRFKIPAAFLPWPQQLMTQGLKISRQEFLKTLPRR